MGSRVTVSDLKSTNGLFVDGKRVERANLDNQSEFRVGDHVLMLIITDRE
jgi:pSer/pThr/pTyr-binding forkhead associated (FHA) protein